MFAENHSLRNIYSGNFNLEIQAIEARGEYLAQHLTINYSGTDPLWTRVRQCSACAQWLWTNGGEPPYPISPNPTPVRSRCPPPRRRPPRSRGRDRRRQGQIEARGTQVPLLGCSQGR